MKMKKFFVAVIFFPIALISFAFADSVGESGKTEKFTLKNGIPV